jgi:hypothetical protein
VHRALLLALLLLWPAVAFAAQVFEGAWFSVRYPDSFIAQGSQKSLASDGYDSAWFRSPNGEVEFYIFSPQVGGKAEDLARVTAGETQVAASEAKSANRIVRWRTYQARDKSHTRSVEETWTPDGLYITRVVAIRYKNAAALAKYKADYAAFKASHEAFAD